MLRDLNEEERDAYFRGVQPIWGGGLAPERFVAFQRRLADSGEAARRYRLLGLFEGPRLLSAMKAYELGGSFANAPLRLLSKPACISSAASMPCSMWPASADAASATVPCTSVRPKGGT